MTPVIEEEQKEPIELSKITNFITSSISIVAAIIFILTFILIYLFSSYYGIEVGLLLNFNFFFAKFFESSILVFLILFIVGIIESKSNHKFWIFLILNTIIFIFGPEIKLLNFFFFSSIEVSWYFLIRKTKLTAKTDEIIEQRFSKISLVFLGLLLSIVLMYVIMASFLMWFQKDIRVLEGGNQAIIYIDNNYAITLDCYEENDFLILKKYSQNIHNTINLKSNYKTYLSIIIKDNNESQYYITFKLIIEIIKDLINIV